MPNNLKGLQMTESIYNNAGMPSEQGTAPEIPESAQVQRYRADIGGDNTVWPIVVSDAKGPLCYYRDHQKRLAALTLERDTLKAEIGQWKTWCIVEIAVRNPSVAEYMEHWEGRAIKAEATVERLSAPVSDEEIPEHQWCEWLHRDKGVPWRMGPSASSAHPEFEQMLNEGWKIVTVSNSFTLLHRIAARASTPPTPLVFTCPFDGEVWRFHTQEQLDMLQKHMDWHAMKMSATPVQKEPPSTGLNGRPSRKFIIEISERQFYAAEITAAGEREVMCETSSWSTVEQVFSDMYTLGSGQTRQFTITDVPKQ
jgi:hypothetical protein